MSEPTPEEAHAQRWQAYFIPGTETMANKLGETDPDRLREREYELTALRAAEIRRGDVDIPRTFDTEHVMATHRHLFQDVYEWAGEFRTVNISKNQQAFATVFEDGKDHSLIETMLDRMNVAVGQTDWKNGSREDIGHGFVEVQGWLNVAHPAREGNGRVQKLLLDQLAERTGRFEIDWSQWKPMAWNFHSAKAMPAPDRISVDHSFFDEAMTRSVRPIGEPKLTKAEQVAQRDRRYRIATADKLKSWNATPTRERNSVQSKRPIILPPQRDTHTGYER